VLSNILDTFNARIFQSNGVYYIDQINDINNKSIYRRLFNYEGTYLSNAINTFRAANMSNLVRLSGGTYTFMPILKKVSTKYNFSQALSSVFLPQQPTYPDWIKIGDDTSALYILRLMGMVRQDLVSTDPSYQQEFYTWFKMYLKIVPIVGDPYYLNNPTSGVGQLTWTQSASELWITLRSAPNSGPQWTDFTPAWDLVSPLTSSAIIGDVYFKFAFFKFTNRLGQPITLPEYVTHTWQCTNMAASIEGQASVLEGEDVYQSLNDNYASLSEDYELPETLLGNNEQISYIGTLICSSDGVNYSSSSEWKVGEVPEEGINIHTIRCREYMLGQMSVIRRYQGTFKSKVKDYHLLPSSYIVIGSKNYGMLNMQLITARDETTGEWYELAVDRNGKDGDISDENTSGWTKAIGYNYNSITRNSIAIDWWFNQNMVAYTASSLASGVSVTGLNTSALDISLENNQALTLYDSFTNYSLDIRVDGAAASGATSITIDAVTPDQDIPSGAYLFINQEDIVYWEDVRIVPSAFDFAGNSDPVLVNYQAGGSGTTFKLYEFDKLDEAFFLVQIPHGYKVGWDINVHIHWTPGLRGNEENGNSVAWKLDYSWANINGTFPASSTVDLTDTCDGTDHKHQMTPDVAISGTGKNISSMLLCRIYRDNGDTWSTNTSGNLPLLLEIDFHVPMDSLGSRLLAAK
jgi:hypothetical protein